MVLVSYEVVTGTVAGGLNLIVTNDVVVEAGGMINADGRGYGGNQGIGNGGEAGSPQSGGGGALGGDGGRIAIYSPANTFTGMVSVAGGPGFASGSTGTVHTTAATLPSFGILSHSPSGAVSNTVHSVDLFFNAALDANSVSSDDFQVVTPYGMLSATSLAVSIPGLSQVRVSFADQNALGTYQLVVGTNITDLFGQPLSLAYVGAFNVALDTVSGMVTDTNGLPVAGVVLQPNGGLTAVFTEMDGGYALGLPSGWTGTVTPHLDGFMFVPQSRSYTNFNGALTGHNYTIVNTIGPLMSVAIVETNLLASWHGMAGVTYQPQCSTNLVDWEPYGPLLHGSNTLSGFTVPLDPDPRKFFKVEAGN
jgi:hypothetical protein